jgi:hypothetical protein
MPRGKNLRPEAGAKTQFGQPGGPDPRIATKNGPPKWSIRKQLAYLASQNVDLSDRDAVKNLLGSNPSIAQVIAAAALIKASKGDMQAIGYATENIDGKLPQISELTGKDGAQLQGPVIYLPANGRDNASS